LLRECAVALDREPAFATGSVFVAGIAGLAGDFFVVDLVDNKETLLMVVFKKRTWHKHLTPRQKHMSGVTGENAHREHKHERERSGR